MLSNFSMAGGHPWCQCVVCCRGAPPPRISLCCAGCTSNMQPTIPGLHRSLESPCHPSGFSAPCCTGCASSTCPPPSTPPALHHWVAAGEPSTGVHRLHVNFLRQHVVCRSPTRQPCFTRSALYWG